LSIRPIWEWKKLANPILLHFVFEMGMHGHHSKIKGVFPHLKENPMFEKDKEIYMYLFI
jgi:hypothetical protein